MREKRESLLPVLEDLKSHQSPQLQSMKDRKDEDTALAVFLFVLLQLTGWVCALEEFCLLNSIHSEWVGGRSGFCWELSGKSGEKGFAPYIPISLRGWPGVIVPLGSVLEVVIICTSGSAPRGLKHKFLGKWSFPLDFLLYPCAWGSAELYWRASEKLKMFSYPLTWSTNHLHSLSNGCEVGQVAKAHLWIEFL